MAILFLLDQWWMTELSVKDRYKTGFFFNSATIINSIISKLYSKIQLQGLIQFDQDEATQRFWSNINTSEYWKRGMHLSFIHSDIPVNRCLLS